MADAYYDDRVVNRQRLIWAIATRRQLERWEPYVATHIAAGFGRSEALTNAEIWTAAIEHHFALVAARHLIDAVELAPARPVPIDPTVRSELIEGRDLHEHWRENVPIFNVRRGSATPGHRSGKEFAARNPDRSPYWWLGWTPPTGPKLLPNVSAQAVHEFSDAVEADVLAHDDEEDHPSGSGLTSFVPPRAPSPWVHENGEWWPKAFEAADP